MLHLLSPCCKKFSCRNCFASDFKATLFPLRCCLISQYFFISSIRFLAEWIVNGYPSENVWPLDLKRFGTLQSSRTFLRHRVMEVMRKWGLCVQLWPECPRFSSLLPCFCSAITLRNIFLLPDLLCGNAAPSQEKGKNEGFFCMPACLLTFLKKC